MQMTRLRKSLSLIVCIVLIAAMALITTGCTDNKREVVGDSASEHDVSLSDTKILGNGKTSFHFTITDGNGKETSFEIHTDEKMVGEALLELELIAGEEGAYGLYVTAVNNETHSFETDGLFWAFYEDGKQAPKGVDQTKIIEGRSYAFKAEKIR